MGTYNLTVGPGAFYISNALTGLDEWYIHAEAQAYTLTLQTAAGREISGIISDGVEISHTDPLDVTKQVAGAVSDTTNLTADLLDNLGLVLTEQMTLSQTQAATTTFGVALTQALSAAEALVGAYGATASDSITVTPMQIVAHAYTVVEALGLGDALLPATTFGLTLTQSMALQDLLVNFFSGVLVDDMIITDAQVGTYQAVADLSATVGVSASTVPALLVRVVLSDGVDVTSAQALQMLYNPVLIDAVEVAGAYLSPGEGITTWATNARTGAVTEYTNYAFNSFATVGGRHIGATEDGLYELNGDDDAGVDIISVIKGGMLQLAGSRFSSFRGAYLGMTGAGVVYLKMETGDGKEYVYQVTALSDETTRVKFGKGLRARYFTYTLTTAGQDFDLDTIEFIPIKAARRV